MREKGYDVFVYVILWAPHVTAANKPNHRRGLGKALLKYKYMLELLAESKAWKTSILDSQVFERDLDVDPFLDLRYLDWDKCPRADVMVM